MRISDWSSDVCSSDLDRLVDQRDRAVLHLTRGIALGMDVADFLELQRAFERERIVGAAAEVEHIARGGDEMRHRRDILVVRERGVQGGGRLDQMLDDLTLVGGAKLALRSEEHTSEL